MMHGWGFVGGGFPMRQKFEEQYHCYSVAYADKAHLEVSRLDHVFPFLLLLSPLQILLFYRDSRQTFTERRQNTVTTVRL